MVRADAQRPKAPCAVPGNGSEPLLPSGDTTAGRKHAGGSPAPRRAIARSRNEPRSTFHVWLRRPQRRIPWPRKPTWSPVGSTIGTTDRCTRTPQLSTSPRRPTCATSSASPYRHAKTRKAQTFSSSTRRTLGALRYELVRLGPPLQPGRPRPQRDSVRSAQESPRAGLLRPADRHRERKARCGRRRSAQA